MSMSHFDGPQDVERPSPSPGKGRENEWGWLGLVLDLQPFPSLVVDLRSAAVVLDNQAARGIPLGPRVDAGDRAASYAERAGTPVEVVELARALATAAGAGGTEIAWRAPDRTLFFRVYGRALPPAAAPSPLTVLTFLDITEQRETEEELRRALAIRDEFFSIATHELKDPLFSLDLSNQLLRHTVAREGEIPEDVLHHLEVGRRQTERLARLIDNLLDVARILNRRLQLDLEALDLGELAADAAARFQERAVPAGTPIVVETPGPVIGHFDRLKLEQVIGNLLSNALKYGGGQPVAVRIRADEETAVIEVEDHGPGIAPGDRERIFGRFERASAGHRKESLGLGLYIVRSLVEAHGGQIDVRSEPGLGATFTVTLPRKRLPAAAADGQASTRG
jgi:signal transduction histidine kinase